MRIMKARKKLSHNILIAEVKRLRIHKYTCMSLETPDGLKRGGRKRVKRE